MLLGPSDTVTSNYKYRAFISYSHKDEKRRILHVLGDAALGEHAQWILMHRERSLEQGEIFRMSG